MVFLTIHTFLEICGMFTELGRAIGRAFENAADNTIDAADEHPSDSPCVPYSTVMAMLHQLEWQAKKTEREIFEALGKQK